MELFTKIRQEHLETIGEVSVSAPSNIALIKYWGKHGRQLAQNPSLSLTLENARTFLTLAWRGRTYLKEGPGVELVFDGEAAPKFAAKIKSFLDDLDRHELPYLKYFDFTIKTHNTFPHSSGIASSASSMAALAAALVLMGENVFQEHLGQTRLQQMSLLARLGSGSAARSLDGPYTQWGRDQNFGAEEYATALTDYHQSFAGLRDSILLIDKGAKAVSSREGHALMNGHPYASARFEKARENLRRLKEAMRIGHWGDFVEIVESEALELHGLMMSSRPSYILMRPQTLKAIELIREARRAGVAAVCFTLDAGANVHVLYREADQHKAMAFIDNELAPLCEDGQVIHDHVGKGWRQEI